MATVRVDADTLNVELSRMDVFVWTIHGSFHIPLANVSGAGTDKPPSFWESLKLLGSNVPGFKMGGTFVYHGEVVFFDYGRDDAVLVVDLVNNNYKHLFVHVDAPDTPEAAAKRINDALAARSAPTAPTTTT